MIMPDYATMPIIETHCHVGWVTNIVELQQTEKLRYALLIDGDWARVIALVREDLEHRGALLAYNPTKQSTEDLRQAISANKDAVKGIKLNPSADNYKPGLEALDSVFALANETGVIVVTHTDSSTRSGLFGPVLEKYPRTTLILYHACPMDEAFALVNKYRNAYIDVSFTAFNKELQQAALKQIGRKKIVFGIDSPLGFPEKDGRCLPHYRDAAREVGAFYGDDKDVVEHVLYKNAMRILKLK
jgi:predicted TIM-barrel fold metal-dependent hydrolase